jgi:phage terminase Nu1 subunit (DNA packaging protein)
MSSERYVSRAEIAFIMGDVDVRTITNWVKKHPDFAELTRVKGHDRTFPVLKCLQWQRDRLVADALADLGPPAPHDMEEAELRKMIADAELAELKVAKFKADLVEASVVGMEVSRAFERVAAQLKSKPGEFAPQILQPLTMPEAVAILRRLVGSALGALQTDFGRDALGDRDDDVSESGESEDTAA